MDMRKSFIVIICSLICSACAPVVSKQVPDFASNSPEGKTSKGQDVVDTRFEGEVLSVVEALKPEYQGTELLLSGVVIYQYVCPPCPPRADCEMCMNDHVVLSDNYEDVNGYAHAAGRNDWLFLDASSEMEHGARYIVQVSMEGRRGNPSTSGMIIRAKKVKGNAPVR